MTRLDQYHSFRSSFGALATILLPVVTLAVSAIGLVDPDVAAWIVVGTLAATLLIISAREVRGTALPWFRRAFLVGSLGALGLLVIGVQTLAHNH